MAKAGAQAPQAPSVLFFEREKHILDGIVESRSSDGNHVAQIRLEATFLCGCTASTARDTVCAHLQALLASLTPEELREWIASAQVIP